MEMSGKKFLQDSLEAKLIDSGKTNTDKRQTILFENKS